MLTSVFFRQSPRNLLRSTTATVATTTVSALLLRSIRLLRSWLCSCCSRSESANSRRQYQCQCHYWWRCAWSCPDPPIVDGIPGCPSEPQHYHSGQIPARLGGPARLRSRSGNREQQPHSRRIGTNNTNADIRADILCLGNRRLHRSLRCLLRPSIPTPCLQPQLSRHQSGVPLLLRQQPQPLRRRLQPLLTELWRHPRPIHPPFTSSCTPTFPFSNSTVVLLRTRQSFLPAN